MEVAIKDLRYRYAMGDRALEGVSFTIKAGEKIAIAGMHAAGKHTLAKLLAGVMTDYTGSITYNQISLRDIHPSSLRPIVSNYLFEDAVFSGSILENVAMNRPGISYEDVRWALNNVGLQHYMNKLPEGLYTHIGADGQHPSEGVTHKILFARAIVSKPKLLVVKDTLPEMCRTDRTQLIQFMTSREMPWTLVVVSNDAMLLSQCDKVLVFDDGHLVTQGSYLQVKDHPVLREAILQD